MASQDKRYSAAANTNRKRMPVHMEADSSIPPIMAPSKFEPSASPEKASSAKLFIKTIPAKNTGRQRTKVANRILTQRDTKNNLSRGTRTPAKSVKNKPA